MKPPVNSLKKIHGYFMDTNKSLCVAESCTGGLVSYWLTHLPDSSKYFKGGLVSYREEVKIKVLGLNVKKIKKEGLVTKDCALSMAQAAKKLLKADYALSVTGVAGPSPGTLGEPVGQVAFALCLPKKTQSSIQYFKGPTREDIRYQSAIFALNLLISFLK